MVKSLRGMKDLIESEGEKFEYIIDTMRDIVKRYSFKYIETPILEESSLFIRSVGESSDIVGKEMYRFIDKGGNDVSLRPEGTAGVVRAIIQKKFDKQPNFKGRYYYFGPMFRYERPQKGRFREFHQFGVESFGFDSVYEDFSIIEMAYNILKSFNLDFKLKINSLGCSSCMPNYREDLVTFLEGKRDNLCEDCQRRIDTNPIRVLDCKNSSCQEILKDAPLLKDNLCESCRSDIEELMELLKDANIEFEYDSKLVRGLDYYTKSAFEFVTNKLGAQSAIIGGGRYDRLVEFLGGKSTPAVGFAVGIERLMELIELSKDKLSGYYLGSMVEDGIKILLKIASNIRKRDLAYVEYEPKSIKAHLKSANRGNFKYALILGEDELKSGKILQKNLEDSTQEEILIESLINAKL
ncbi:MAG: histidine--tRNA ligase [Epsilonproteobacteria bacterium]|nr:histidine--tRNA ligase [Campylobacterota bacterium]